MRGVGRRRGYWEEMVRGEQFALPTSLDVQSMRNLGAKPLPWRVSGSVLRVGASLVIVWDPKLLAS